MRTKSTPPTAEEDLVGLEGDLSSFALADVLRCQEDADDHENHDDRGSLRGFSPPSSRSVCAGLLDGSWSA